MTAAAKPLSFYVVVEYDHQVYANFAYEPCEHIGTARPDTWRRGVSDSPPRTIERAARHCLGLKGARIDWDVSEKNGNIVWHGTTTR